MSRQLKELKPLFIQSTYFKSNKTGKGFSVIDLNLIFPPILNITLFPFGDSFNLNVNVFKIYLAFHVLRYWGFFNTCIKDVILSICLIQ